MSDIQSVGYSSAGGLTVATPVPVPPAGADPKAAKAVGTPGAMPGMPHRAERPTVAPRPDPQVAQRQFQDVVRELNLQMEKSGRALEFSIDKAIPLGVVTVHNKETGDVVRQIPLESVLNVAHSIESLKGILYSKVI